MAIDNSTINSITIGKNYSKFALLNVNIQLTNGVTLYGVEIKQIKVGKEMKEKIIVTHQTSYKDKEGKTAFTSNSFIPEDMQKEIVKRLDSPIKEALKTFEESRDDKY